MAQWKELPDALDEPGRQFVAELRRLKSGSGLSLAALADRTSCSKSSWERYLNGSYLPPAVVVEELARLGGGDVDRALALRSLAEDSWSAGGGAGSAVTPDALPGPGDAESVGPADQDAAPAAPPRRPARRTALVAATVATLGTLAAATVFLVSRESSGAVNGDDRRGEKAAFVFEPGRTHACDIHREDGLLHAGHSDTRDALLQQISTSWDVVEAQCLLTHRGYSPGLVDGAYGAETEKAVKRFQEAAGLVTDGHMGPHTWEALRR
ncbi:MULTISPECIES: peptidoglycan-binding protein [Streptomyces]|uniref:peptidoglycan-binding protein n=1 Tax=Streptomyces TaxID=1883 RepID=UPI001E5203E0|nr:peptidoglycan-binding protein [Streptomyces sp. DH1]